MMNRHYAAMNGTAEDVEMPFELSGMMVDRRPAKAAREPISMSGIGFEPPEVRPRPAPPELTFRQPPVYPPQQQAPVNLGSIDRPRVAGGNLRGLKGWVAYGGLFAAIMGLTFMGHRYLNQEDDE
jgi:hypothetical protein